MEIREALELYKEYTKNLINLAEKEEFDSFNDFLNKREGIITEMKGLEYSTEQFNNISKELDIMNLEEKLKSLINDKKETIRREIERLAQNKNANVMYNKKDYTDSRYFNEKI